MLAAAQSQTATATKPSRRAWWAWREASVGPTTAPAGAPRASTAMEAQCSLH